MFRKMPFILVGIIAAIMVLGPIMPLSLKQSLYSISLTIKSIVILVLPIIIFGLLFKAAVMLSKNATKIIGAIFVFVCLSNFLSTFISHYVGEWIYHFKLTTLAPNDATGLKSLWTLHLPMLIANNKAMLSGIMLGLVAAKLYPAAAITMATRIETFISKLLRGFSYFIPLFVAGFFVKLQHDNVMSMIIKDYTAIFLFIALTQFSYIILLYGLLDKFNVKSLISNIKNMLPATISGFSTMSSAASMPLTIIGAENNAQNKDVAKSVIPITVNIHLIGDCFAIPILAYAVLKNFGFPDPTLSHYLFFSCYFVLAKFSVAAIPGGGIIVMLPILGNYLGFNGEMMSLITALYVLFDPVITCANVLGNGAFAKLIDNWLLFLAKRQQSKLTITA